MDDKPRATVYILTTIISATAVIIAAILGSEPVAREILRVLRTKTITISASPGFSGASIYLAGDDMLTFLEASRIGAVGDTETDQLTKGFFSFYLGELPPDSEIVEVELRIPCDVEGSPEMLGTLTLQEYAFGTYSQASFYGVPPNNWKTEWIDTVSAMNACRSGAILSVSGPALARIIQQRLASEWIQFVFYINSNLIIPNQSIDAVVLTAPPMLVVRYRESEP